MRTVIAFAAAILSGTSVMACNIDSQTNLKLDLKDRAIFVSLGKAINAQDQLRGTGAAALFSEPAGTVTLNVSDAKTLAQVLKGLRKATACHANRITMERIADGNTAGIRFLRQIEECLADACVDNQ